MLADTLDSTRGSITRDIEPRLLALEPFGLPAAQRRARVDTLLDELVRALRRGSIDEQLRPASIADESVAEQQERELLQNYIIDRIEQRDLEASLAETRIVSGWNLAADRDRFREHANRLSALLDRVDESAAVLSPEGRIRYLNRAAQEILHDALGHAAHEIIGRTGAELRIPSEFKINSAAELAALARDRTWFETEVMGRLKEARISAMYAQDGSLCAVEWVSRDVHERKLARARLDVLNRLSMLVGSVNYDQVGKALAQVPIPDLADWCCVTVYKDGEVHDVAVAQRDPGKTALCERVSRIVSSWRTHPLWRQKLTAGFQLLTEVTDELLRRTVVDDDDYRTLTQVGIRSLMVLPLVPRFELAGTMTLLFTDESGRRYGRDHPPIAEELALHASHLIENTRLMQQIKASEARFRVALASARTLVYEQDRDLRYTWSYNPAVPDNTAGETQEESVSTDDAVKLRELKGRVIEHGEGAYERTSLNVAGEQRHFRQAVEPLRDDSGAIVGVIGAATDITDEQRAQEELREAVAFRERLMSVLGHDLRSPLNAVSMAAQQLQRSKDLSASAADQATRIGRATRRMNEMIATLLDFTRLRVFGKLPISFERSDLGDIVREVIEELSAVSPEKQIDLELRGDVHGLWDPGRIAQMTSNLIGNAITYGVPRTPVKVAVSGLDGDVSLTVRNEGPPIAAELIPQLFEPYRRGVPEEHSPQGLGLGLYVAKQIALMHSGAIDVESTAEHGTTFTVRLPRRPAASENASPPRRNP